MAAPVNREQFTYYLRVSIRHDLIRERRGLRFAWNHFWSARWYWSNGHLATPPIFEQTRQGERTQPNQKERK
jgi:hypothetical protein